jgi:hypothetical protein
MSTDVRGQSGRVILGVGILSRLFILYGYVRVPVRAIVPCVCVRLFMCHAR